MRCQNETLFVGTGSPTRNSRRGRHGRSVNDVLPGEKDGAARQLDDPMKQKEILIRRVVACGASPWTEDTAGWASCNIPVNPSSFCFVSKETARVGSGQQDIHNV